LFKPVIGDGTYAEYVGAPAPIVARKPVTVGFAEASALPTPGLTAMDLVDAVDTREGETILIVGATGGVGSYATQLMARRGAHVIATARRTNEALVRKLGAAETIDHTTEDIVDAVRMAHPGGIDAVIDVASDREALGRISTLVNEGGRLASSVYAADVEGLTRRGIGATNVSMQPESWRLDKLSRMVDSGELSVRLDRTFPLEKAPQALEEMRTGHIRGKIVLLIH
jgi:NADPH:quinone reductase-like Zn-dependent oxidoreductase